MLRQTAFILAATFTAAQSARGAIANVYDIGTLGGSRSWAMAVNNQGQVAGYSVAQDGANHAFLYDWSRENEGTLRDLGTIGGTGTSYGVAINDAGQLVGNSNGHVFLYDSAQPGATMTDLGTMGGTNTQAFGVNLSGQIAGVTNVATGNILYLNAFLYSPASPTAGTVTRLGSLGGGNTLAFAINSSGQVAGLGALSDNTAAHVFRYDPIPAVGGVMVDLGSFGGNDCSGNAINDSGQVTGFCELPGMVQGNVVAHAFLYSGTPGSGGAMADLGTLGGIFSDGFGINSYGQIVGTSSLAINVNHAFLYTGIPGQDGRMIDLDAWLDANNPAEGASWTLTEARGINDAGLIVGCGTYSDGTTSATHAFLLDASPLTSVPEPSSLAVLALASTLVLRRQRICKRRIVQASSK